MLLSCITPATNQRDFVPQPISYFLTKNYPVKELIILDDGEMPVPISFRIIPNCAIGVLDTRHLLDA